MQPLSDGVAFVLGGAAALVGSVLGWINFTSLLEPVIIGAAGSIGGVLGKYLISVLFKIIKATYYWLTKKNKQPITNKTNQLK